MLKRNIENTLLDYYKSDDSNILIINGARQVGKSYIIRKTASEFFENYIEINLKDDFDGLKKFQNITNTYDFYLLLSTLYGYKLGNNNDTIIFLDEIQVYPQLLTLLKALKLENKYRYICSGSLLGITLKHTFIPMGAIKEIKMYPLTFEEFMINNNISEETITYLFNCYKNKTSVNENIHNIILKLFKEYLITGGMPEAVNEYIETKNIYNVRLIQQQILDFYKDDASQYDIEHSLKIRRIYDLIPTFADNKIKRFIYKDIENKRNKQYEKYQDEFDYLIYSGCVYKAHAVSNIRFPLMESLSKNLIKLYLNDVGLLSNILFRNNADSILFDKEPINLGSLYETFAAQQLIYNNNSLYYFDSKKVGEVDFLISNYESLSVLPLEIKSGKNFNNYRAIPKLIKEPYNLKEGYIFTNSNIINNNNNLITLPIYMLIFLKS